MRLWHPFQTVDYTLRPTIGLLIAITGAALFGVIPANAESEGRLDGKDGRTPTYRLFVPRPPALGAMQMELNAAALQAIAQSDGPVIVEKFPLQTDRTVDLVVERFSVTGPDTRIVLGRRDGRDVPLDFDPSRVTLLRGHVRNEPNSHVYLAISDLGSTGKIDLGPGEGIYRFSSKGRAGVELPQGRFTVFPAVGGVGNQGSPQTLCGLDTTGEAPFRNPPVSQGQQTIPGLQFLEMAIETDYEFFELFGEPEAAAAYIIELYGAVSDIYIRDANTWIEVSFFRLWETPDDLFNEPNPLSAFRSYWNENMQHVHRDVAQLLSGRRDLPYGGVAWLNGLCNGRSYSVVGYVVGSFPDLDVPSPFTFDVVVTAHELGHNCGALHSQDYGINSCQFLNGVPTRGEIMSYCSQTVSGGDANTDLRFHTIVQEAMKGYIGNVLCVVDDCNMNGVEDGVDVGMGSEDANANGVPDECEDCNQNGELDDADILSGKSRDENGNGIPDECEPDCNDNQTPDDRDISLGDSLDANGNGIPDECEPDCDGNETADHVQIRANMTLDINRNIVLDSCEDCDNDGALDDEELAGAYSIWIASRDLSVVGEYHSITGVRIQNSPPGHVNSGQDLVIGPDEHIYVTSSWDDSVVRFDKTGAYLGDFVQSGSGGLDTATGLLFRENGNLLVSSADSDSVLEYDGDTGAYLGEFVSAGLGGLSAPHGLTIGPNGNLYVSSGGNDQVIEYDGQTGALVRVFVPSGGGGLSQPKGLAFKRDGNLLVASFGNDAVLEYDGWTGGFIGKFNRNGTQTALTLEGPWGVGIGPNGSVFVSRSVARSNGPEEPEIPSDIIYLHINSTRIFEFDTRNGNFLRSYVMGNDTGLWLPTGFDFMPGWETDCNQNATPDNCDIASGNSLDENDNEIPDECEADCNENGVPDSLDMFPNGSSFDCNHNGVPDDCEQDCNGNGLHDDCDIANGLSPDENENEIPDECEVHGDGDGDGDVDRFDYSLFLACYGGPGETVGPECEVFDDDEDLDVDLIDFGGFQAGYTGECSFAITQQPIGQEGCLGLMIELSVEVDGLFRAYQWFHNGVRIPGANDAVYTIDPVRHDSAGVYTVWVSSLCGSALSETAQVVVFGPADIVDHPDRVEVCPGLPAQFSVQAIGLEPLSYQWRLNDIPIPGATDATHVIEAASPDDEGTYLCMVENGCGHQSFSDPADLELKPEAVIVDQPVGGTYCVGDDVIVFVIAGGAVSFQWFKDDVALDGEDEFFLMLLSADIDDSGTYHVEIQGECNGVSSEPAAVSVLERPECTENP